GGPSTIGIQSTDNASAPGDATLLGAVAALPTLGGRERAGEPGAGLREGRGEGADLNGIDPDAAHPPAHATTRTTRSGRVESPCITVTSLRYFSAGLGRREHTLGLRAGGRVQQHRGLALLGLVRCALPEHSLPPTGIRSAIPCLAVYPRLYLSSALGRPSHSLAISAVVLRQQLRRPAPLPRTHGAPPKRARLPAGAEGLAALDAGGPTPGARS